MLSAAHYSRITGNKSPLYGATITQDSAITRISTGKRINSASDDLGNFSKSTRIKAEIAGIQSCIRGALDAQSLIDTLDSAISSAEEVCIRIRELCVALGGSNLNATDKKMIKSEIANLIDQAKIDDVARKLFNWDENVGAPGSCDFDSVAQALKKSDLLDLTTKLLDNFVLELESHESLAPINRTFQISFSDFNRPVAPGSSISLFGSTYEIPSGATHDEVIEFVLDKIKIISLNSSEGIADARRVGDSIEVELSPVRGEFKDAKITASINLEPDPNYKIYDWRSPVLNSFEIDGVSGTVSATSTIAYGSTSNSHFYFPAEFGVPSNLTKIVDGGQGPYTISFEAPVNGFMLAFESIGRGNYPVRIEFDKNFLTLWEMNMPSYGEDYLYGAEGFAIIKFPDQVSDITINVTKPEQYIHFFLGKEMPPEINFAEVQVSIVSDGIIGISAIDEAFTGLSTLRASAAALSNGIEHMVNQLTGHEVNLLISSGRIEDADLTAESIRLATSSIISKSSIEMLSAHQSYVKETLSLLFRGE